MSKNRMIDTSLWSDPWIVDHLNPLDRYLFLYLLTNEKTTVAGIYEISLRTMANETGIEKEELARMMARLETRVAYEDGWVVLRKFIKHQNTRNIKIRTGILDQLSRAPQHLISFIDFPDDFSYDTSVSHGDSTMSDDDSSMTHEESSHLNTNTNSNTNLNTNTNTKNKTKAADNSAGGNIPREKPIKTEAIDDLMAYWHKTTDVKPSNSKDNRLYAARLLREHSVLELEKMIDGVAMSYHDKYAPRIANFRQLRTKWDDLLAWGKRTQNERQQQTRTASI